MDPSQPNSAAAGPRAPWRVNGLVVLVVLVVVGMGVTSVFFQWRAPQLYDEMQRVRADTPQSGEPRVDKWLVYGRPFFHARLIQLRYSSSQPWLVTHTVGGERAREPVEIWGVDFAALAPEATSRDGMVVTLTLPEPRLLARERFGLDSNDMANQVPHYPDAASAPDPRQRARSIVEWALKRLLDELGKDIEGATFEVRFAPSGAPLGG